MRVKTVSQNNLRSVLARLGVSPEREKKNNIRTGSVVTAGKTVCMFVCVMSWIPIAGMLRGVRWGALRNGERGGGGECGGDGGCGGILK